MLILSSIENKRRWLVLPLDCILASSAFYLAWVLRFDDFIPKDWPAFPGWEIYFYLLGIQILSAVLSFSFIGIYRNLWAYASLHDMYQILKATLLASLLSVAITWLYNRMENFPRSTIVIEYVLLFLFLSFRSFSWRIVRELKLFHWKDSGKLTLLIGAGFAGNHLARELRSNHLEYAPVAFLDQNPKRIHAYIQGLPVLGELGKLSEALQRYRIEQVIITEKLSGPQMRFIYHTCEKKGISCKALPPLVDMLESPRNVGKALRDIQLEDFLGRDAIGLETKDIRQAIEDQTILVSGAGGSIASELCRQLLRYNPAALVLLELSENALYEIDRELHSGPLLGSKTRVASVVGSICDEKTLQKVFYENDIQIVFHCAAYKHVPLMELNPEQAIANNLVGTLRLAQAARDAGVERFVMLSTDKAVNPANIMGATKRIAELYVQNLSRSCDTRFLTVRFGNVLGSKGSVVPLFSQQIEAGGPVTVTHPEITRYFMTIPEAVGLVLQAGAMGKGGEIFILDMGEPIKIKELAEDMIRFARLKPYTDIDIQYIGLRPGEKLFEELLLEEESREPTRHNKIHIAMGRNLNLETLTHQIEELATDINQIDRAQVDIAISRIIPEYRPVYRAQPKSKKPLSIRN